MNQINIFDIMRQPVQITKPIRLIELFAGYGSQAMALKRIGAKFEHYRVVEFDKYAIASYNAVHGTDFPTMDITKVHADDLNICDTESFTYLLTYSFPCTDLSVAGKQMGMSKGSGTRSGLLWEVERILKEIRDGGGELPQILFMENVPQVHADANRVDFQNWIDFLTSLGYVSYWQDLNAKNYGVAQNRERCFMFSFLGEYNYHFPQQIPLKKKLKDYLEYDVDEKYYINNEKAEKLIKQLIENGTLPKNNHESRLALTEQSAIHIRETLQTASLQDMTQESATYGQKETVLLKAVDLSINNPKEKIIANCILSHVSKDGNTIGKYASLNTGVIECKKLKL
jgi:DNA (cytosine-5)-methyltransferase 1